MKRLAQGPRAGKGQSWAFKPGLAASNALSVTHYSHLSGGGYRIPFAPGERRKSDI